jgi:hypothetical protein
MRKRGEFVARLAACQMSGTIFDVVRSSCRYYLFLGLLLCMGLPGCAAPRPLSVARAEEHGASVVSPITSVEFLNLLKDFADTGQLTDFTRTSQLLNLKFFEARQIRSLGPNACSSMSPEKQRRSEQSQYSLDGSFWYRESAEGINNPVVNYPWYQKLRDDEYGAGAGYSGRTARPPGAPEIEYNIIKITECEGPYASNPDISARMMLNNVPSFVCMDRETVASVLKVDRDPHLGNYNYRGKTTKESGVLLSVSFANNPDCASRITVEQNRYLAIDAKPRPFIPFESIPGPGTPPMRQYVSPCPCITLSGRYRPDGSPLVESESRADGMHLLFDRTRQFRVDGASVEIEKTYAYNTSGVRTGIVVVTRELQADGSTISQKVEKSP